MKTADATTIRAVASDKKTDGKLRAALLRALPRDQRRAEDYEHEVVVRGVRLRFLTAEDAQEYQRRAGK